MKPLMLTAAALLLLAAQDAPVEFARAVLLGEPDAATGPLGTAASPQWESDKVAYRLNLDDGGAPDVIGKTGPDAISPKPDRKGLVAPALAAGNPLLGSASPLGIGGIGVLRAGRVTAVGPAWHRAHVINTGDRAEAVVETRGFDAGGGTAYLTARYSIAAGSPLTHVSASVIGAAPEMVAGMMRAPGAQMLEGGFGAWRYVASWGRQGRAKQQLGLALFYNRDFARDAAARDGSYTLSFCDPLRMRYAFAASWVRQPGAPQTADAYRAWLDQTAEELAATSEVEPLPACR